MKQTKKSTRRFSTKISHVRLLNFTLAFALVGTLFLLLTSAAPAVGFYGSIEQDQVDRINWTRGANGKGSLQHIECLNTIAETWAVNMSIYGLRHNPNLAADVTEKCGNQWAIIGENVGVGSDSAGIFNAFMKSPAHKDNILGGYYGDVGVGAYRAGNGNLYITQVFVGCGNCSGNWNTNANLPGDPVSTNNNPKGNVDTANCDAVAGWTYDPNEPSSSIDVHIYMDAPFGGRATSSHNLGPTNVARPDVNSAFGITGNHGFSWKIPAKYMDGRSHNIYVYGINVGAGEHWSTARTIKCDGPTGNVDTANCRNIAGWTYDRVNPSASNDVHVYIDGAFAIYGKTNVARPDVNSAFGISGTHGFALEVPDRYRDGKTHTAVVYGISTVGTNNPVIGTRTLDACANPIGNVDATSCDGISGWTLDMNDPARSIDVHVYVDGGWGGAYTANTSRPDVNSYFAPYGVTGNHGFFIPTPKSWKDGRQHTINTFAINIGNGNSNPLIRSTTLGPCY